MSALVQLRAAVSRYSNICSIDAERAWSSYRSRVVRPAETRFDFIFTDGKLLGVIKVEVISRKRDACAAAAWSHAGSAGPQLCASTTYGQIALTALAAVTLSPLPRLPTFVGRSAIKLPVLLPQRTITRRVMRSK